MVLETSYTKLLFASGSIAISSFLTYLGLDEEAFALFACLLGIDYSTGILKAKAIGDSITSNKMKYGVASKLSLIFIPIVLAMGAKAVNGDFALVLTVGINILVLSEVYSIIGNIYSIRNKEELPEYDVVAILGKKIRTVLLRNS